MKIIEHPQISNVDWWLVLDDDGCGHQFLVAPDERKNGYVKCEYCPNVNRVENIKDESK